jgi:hypothetical protein
MKPFVLLLEWRALTTASTQESELKPERVVLECGMALEPIG